MPCEPKYELYSPSRKFILSGSEFKYESWNFVNFCYSAWHSRKKDKNFWTLNGILMIDPGRIKYLPEQPCKCTKFHWGETDLTLRVVWRIVGQWWPHGLDTTLVLEQDSRPCWHTCTGAAWCPLTLSVCSVTPQCPHIAPSEQEPHLEK